MQSLLLINAAHPLRQERTAADMAEFRGVLLDAAVVPSLRRLFEAAGADGKITAVSGFRSHAEQSRLYAECLAENGRAFTENYVALPGCSEHESGLAVDLAEIKERIDPVRPDFPYSGVCQKLREKAPYYGWIQRYEKGKGALTRIAEEPWHFRYVGYPHSRIMAKTGMCLEEYTAYLLRETAESHPLCFRDDYHQYEIFRAAEGCRGALDTNAGGFVALRVRSYETACGH